MGISREKILSKVFFSPGWMGRKRPVGNLKWRNLEDRQFSIERIKLRTSNIAFIRIRN